MSSSGPRKYRSPNRREALNDELNEHTQRIRDLMVADLTLLEEENNSLRLKCLKVEELEEKVELVLRNNEELYAENHKLASLVEEKLLECDRLRSKAEGRRNYDSSHEHEKNRLILEIEGLRAQVAEVEHMKNLTIKEIRSKHQIDLDNLNLAHEADLKAYDEQLIKIRDEMADKSQTLIKTQAQLRSKEDEILKMLADKEKLEQENKIKTEEFARINEELIALRDEKRRADTKLSEYADNFEVARRTETKLRAEADRLKEQIDSGEENARKKEKKLRENIETVEQELAATQQKLKENAQNAEQEIRRREEQIVAKQEQLSKTEQELMKARQGRDQDVQALQGQLKAIEEKKKEEIEKVEKEMQKKEAKHETTVSELRKEVRSLENRHREVVAELEESRQKVEEKYQSRLSAYEEEGTYQSLKNDELKNEIMRMMKESESLRSQVKELGILNEEEVSALRVRLEQLHQEEINQINNTHLTMKNYLERQLLSTEEELKAKDQEINLIIEEKLVMRDRFIEEGKQIKEDFKMLQYEFKLTEEKSREELVEVSQQLLDMQIKYREMKDQYEQKCKELGGVTQANAELKNDMKNGEKTRQEIEIELKERAEQWKESFFNAKAELEKSREDWEGHKKDWEQRKEELHKQHEEAIRTQQRELSKLERQNESIKGFIGTRDKGIDELLDKVNHLSRVIEQREATIEQLREEALQGAQKHSSKLSEQKSIWEKKYKEKIKYVTEDFQTRNTILETNLDIALKELKAKENQLEELVTQYELMRGQMITLTEQEAHKKKVSLKFAGATADLIASKNMFDVFVKAKVLQTCGDAMEEKENHQCL